jgi:preprotein translocase subunit SecE
MKNPLRSVANYFTSAQEELRKVSWPSKQDTTRYSALVIGVSVAVAAFFGVLDLGLNKLVDATIASRAAPIEAPAQPDIQLTPVSVSSTGGEATIAPTTPSTPPTP